MHIREEVKELMRLIDGTPCESELEGQPGSCPDRRYGVCGVIRRIDCCAAMYLAEHLIASGTTVQHWVPVTDRLPDLVPCDAGTAYSEAVIVWTDNKKAMIAVWDGTDFLCPADYWEAWGEKITHWMPLPQPPKEATCSAQKK